MASKPQTQTQTQPHSAQARLVENCAALHAEPPGPMARRHLLALVADTYAIARYARVHGVGGAALDGSIAVINRKEVPQHASVWGGGTPPATAVAPAAYAALLNGCAAEALDFQEVLIDGRNNGHAAVVIVPALLALAETGAHPLHPETLLAGLRTAFVANVALARALGRQHRQGAMGFRTTSLISPIAAALGGALMLGASEDEAGHAVALATTMLPAGLLAAMAPQSSDFTPDKDIAIGLAARHAVECVHLAMAGARGPADALTGPRGWFASYGFDDTDRTALTDPLGEDVLNHYALKLYPANFGCQCAIRLALEAARMPNKAPIVRADIRVKSSSAQSLSSRTLSSHVAARFSLPYAVASALVRGRSTLPDFDGDALRDDAVLAMMDVVTLTGDDELERRHRAEGIFPARLTVTRADGSSETAHLDTPQDGMSEATFRTAFQSKIESLCSPDEAAAIEAAIATQDGARLLAVIAGTAAQPSREYS